MLAYGCLSKSPPTPQKFENGTFTPKNHIKYFLSTLCRKNLKTQQSPAAILDLCFRKTRAEKSRDYRDVIVFEKLRF